MSRRVRRIAFAIGLGGLIVSVGCAVALYISGIMIDEQQMRPGFEIFPLLAGIASGTLAAIAGFGTWVVGYVPAVKSSHHD